VAGLWSPVPSGNFSLQGAVLTHNEIVYLWTAEEYICPCEPGSGWVQSILVRLSGTILKFRFTEEQRARGLTLIRSSSCPDRADERTPVREKQLSVELDENLNLNVNLEAGEESPTTLTTICSTPSPAPTNMEIIQDQIRSLLEGRPFEETSQFSDFTLEDQYDLVAAKGVAPSSPLDFTPTVKKSVVYIVGAVIFNEKGEVLMMQEAKSSCAGQWYLPAGKMEPGEDISEAAVREVLEETGLEFEVSTLLLVESAGGSWYRFVVTGHVTGGRLKTPADADSESLQAKWVEDISKMSLRANDILPHIERGKLYHYATKRSEALAAWHTALLPALRPHKHLLLRTVILIRKKTNNRVNVLVSEKTEAHLPVADINPMRSIHSTLKKFMTEIFGAEIPQHKLHGILSVEHSGRPANSNDGSCITLLISVKVPAESVCLIDKYSWLEVERSLGEHLLSKLAKNMTVPLVVIR